MAHKVLVFLKAFTLVLLLHNGTMTNKTSTHGRENPAVNCKGTLTDKSGNHYPVIENITIAGLYKQVRVYIQPKNKTENITEHRAYLDPIELTKLKTGAMVTHNKKEYLELFVTNKESSTTTTYLIEPTAQVKYTIPLELGDEEREITMRAVDTMTFSTCQKPVEEEETTPKKKNLNQKK